jgi:hypothetical protein
MLRPLKRRDWLFTPEWVWKANKSTITAGNNPIPKPIIPEAELRNPKDKNYGEAQPSATPRQSTTDRSTEIRPKNDQRHELVEVDRSVKPKMDQDKSEKGSASSIIDSVKSRTRAARKILDL